MLGVWSLLLFEIGVTLLRLYGLPLGPTVHKPRNIHSLGPGLLSAHLLLNASTPEDPAVYFT